jgi:DNA polymerase III delta prime subunit
MQPLLVHISSTDQRDQYIRKYKHTHNLSDLYTTHIEPEKKQIRIDQIRTVKKLLIHTQTTPQLLVVHQFDTATPEAQNAFLKTLEEHDPLIHILLIVQNIHSILPTVLSRCRIIQKREKDTGILDEENKEIKEIIETLIQNHSLNVLGNKGLQVKTWHEAQYIFDAIITILRKRFHTEGSRVANLLRTALTYRSSVSGNNTNPQMSIDKLILEIHQAYRS